MLSWPPGPRATDGVWAKHWYGEVEKSTGFRPYQPKQIDLPDWLLPIYAVPGNYEHLTIRIAYGRAHQCEQELVTGKVLMRAHRRTTRRSDRITWP